MAEMTTKDEVVRYDGRQALTGDEKAQARANIGAGTSDFSGSYAHLTGVPQSFPPSRHAATHGAGGADAVTVAQSQVEGLGEALAAKQDALTSDQLANIDAVPKKADEFTIFEIEDDALKSRFDGQPTYDAENQQWNWISKAGVVWASEPFIYNDESERIEIEGRDPDDHDMIYFYATRARVLRTGDAPTAQEVEALIDTKTDAIIAEKLADIDPDNASIYDLIKALKGE